MTQNLPRDVFLYLLSVITLIAVAVSTGVVLFQIINVYVPDIVSDPYFSRSTYYDEMRASLAVLIVVFPVFFWVSRFLRKDLEKNPEKRELKIRKWLLYFTLFVASLVIIGDLISLLRGFLNGELSQRFVLKVLAVLMIAGSVFIHYFSELREKVKQFKWIRSFDWVIVSLVALIVISAILIAGSPQNQRLVRLDERRTSDLQSIQWQIINYWQRKETIPASLDQLNDPIGGFVVPVDPETGENYEYAATGKLAFRLCANFKTTNRDESSREGSSAPVAPVLVNEKSMEYMEGRSPWIHNEGRFCFEREIDPVLYPPLKDAVRTQ